jgi:hypothetical protein
MLVINKDNLKFFTNRSSGISEVLERYESTRLDLPEEDIYILLRKGALTRAQMLRAWTRLTPERVRAMDINTFARNELVAVTTNPKINHLAFTVDVFRDTLPPSYFVRCYDNITLQEAHDYNVRLDSVLNNPTVSVEVKRALIEQAFQDGTLPITQPEDLRRYSLTDASPAIIKHLEQINHPTMLVDPALMELSESSDWNYLTSRLILMACSTYNEELTEQLLLTTSNHFNSNEFYANLKSPDTVTQTEYLLSSQPTNPRAIKYLAAKGRFDKSTIHDIMAAIAKHGKPVDMIALYENDHLTSAMRETVYPEIAVAVGIDSFRRQLFDKLILNASKELLNEFCLTYKDDPSMMFFLQTPRAYKRSALYCIEHVDADAISVSEIIAKCPGVDFSDDDLDLVVARILDDVDDDTVMRFLLMSGVSQHYKDQLMAQLKVGKP